MLTDAQWEVLQAMANGHKMVFSQDGEMAWLWPTHQTGFLTIEQTCGLRDMGYIAAEPYDEDRHGRFGPPDVITPARRRALEEGQ